MGANLYIHFPFCRTKCAYCVLHSRAGSTEAQRAAYVAGIRDEVVKRGGEWSTVYFGGGSPALCDLRPLFGGAGRSPVLWMAPDAEFTVELHPLDVTRSTLEMLRSIGVNRISMGVQSFDNAVLMAMRRGYTIDQAHRAFDRVHEYFDNCGIDLIVGYPGEEGTRNKEQGTSVDVGSWGLRHCSLYTLILEPESILCRQYLKTHGKPLELDDDALMDARAAWQSALEAAGLARYEISSYAVPGYECRHNLAVWSGEDYIGLGEGAYGREGLVRTCNGAIAETLTPDEDRRERTLFRLRTRLGLDTAAYPTWREALDFDVSKGLLTRAGTVYRLTPRGAEVCDAILAELV